MQRRTFVLTLGMLTATGGGAWAAEPLFRQPIRLIVPATPGGFTDIAARLLGDQLGSRLGQVVVIDNRAGASGIIGSEAVAKSAPDGTTLLMGTIQSHGMSPGLFKKLPYDVVKDFAPVTRVAMGYNNLVVPASSPVHSLKDLIDLAKKSPGAVTYGSAGSGASSHLLAEMLRQAAGIELLHVPYKGTAPALQALIAGQISMMFDPIPSSLPHVKAGTLRALAVTSPRRLSNLPDIPAVAETLTGFEMAVWVGIYAPAGTPARVVEVLNREIQAALKEPAVVQRFEQLGFVPSTLGPAEFAEFTRSEIKKWLQVVTAAKIVPE